MEKDSKADAIIATASLSAVGAAAIPVPIADTIMITGIQIGMLVSISAIYGNPINKDTAKGLILTYATAQVGMWAASSLKAIPGLGTLAGIATVAGIAGSLTATLGIAFKALAKSGKKVTPENLKIEIKNSKEEANRLAAQFKVKTIKTNELKSKINFHAKPESFSNKIEFIFDVSDLRAESIRVTKLNGGEPVWQTSSVTSPIVWKPEKLENGIYIAYLDIADLIPIPFKITKI